jgi:hypothetical protein
VAIGVTMHPDHASKCAQRLAASSVPLQVVSLEAEVEKYCSGAAFAALEVTGAKLLPSGEFVGPGIRLVFGAGE